MCCLRYEHETYEREIRLTPAVESLVQTRDGRGVVISNHVLKGTVTVKLEGQEGEAPRTYHRDEVKVLGGRGHREDAPENKSEAEE